MALNRFKSKLVQIAKKHGYDIRKTIADDIKLYSNYDQELLNQKPFLNIGAGNFQHKYWMKLDYKSEYYTGYSDFVNFDLMSLKPLPFKDNSLEVVYTSHTIEHVSDDAVRNVFKEAFRVLKPGGIIRITAPDIELEYSAFQRNDVDYWYWRNDHPNTWMHLYTSDPAGATVPQLFLNHFAGQLSQINICPTKEKKYSDEEIKEIFKVNGFEGGCNYFTSKCEFVSKYAGHHINWWSKSKVKNFLKEAGFNHSYDSGFGQSKCKIMRNITLFDKTHPRVSLYVEAMKK